MRWKLAHHIAVFVVLALKGQVADGCCDVFRSNWLSGSLK